MDSAESGKGLKSIRLNLVKAFRAPVKTSGASSDVWGRMSKDMLIFFILSPEKNYKSAKMARMRTSLS